MSPSKVVLDADWFVIDGEKYVKQLAYSIQEGGRSGLYTFSLPRKASDYCKSLTLQAKHSHGLLWHTKGQLRHNQLACAFADIFKILDLRPAEVIFYAKGLEKCRLLESFVPEVLNLDDFGCPTYKELCTLKQTTLRKAVIFNQWLE